MGTRACIARKTPQGFQGRYHHWDGYPTGLGKALFTLYEGHFRRDLEAMLKTLVDDHPAGWSTICDKDFGIEPGFEERTPCVLCGKEYSYNHDQENGHEFRLSNRPRCYCHGDRREGPWEVNQKNAAGSGCEWAYVFERVNGKDIMHILSSYCSSRGIKGQKMIGCFGYGDRSAVWVEIFAVDLDAQEAPDWAAIADSAKEGRSGAPQRRLKRGVA